MYCCSSSLDIASSLSPMIRAHDVQQALSLITKARRVLCICHRAPDGDAIGSLLSMGLLLEQHLVNVPVLFHCIDAVPETFRFLPGVWRVRSDLLPQPGDAVIFLDCAEQKLTGYSEKHPSLFRGDFPGLLIPIVQHVFSWGCIPIPGVFFIATRRRKYTGLSLNLCVPVHDISLL